MGVERSTVTVILVAMSVAGASGIAQGLEPENVLVLYNSSSPAGLEIASYYASVHPGVQLLGLQNVSTAEEVSASHYLDVIRPQVLSSLTNQIECIVTTKGLPLRIDNPGQYWRYSSLESELTAVVGIGTPTEMGTVASNPYFLTNAGFSHDSTDGQMRMASRLDGFTVEDVKASIARAQTALVDRAGYTFLLDDHPGRTDWMEDLAETLASRGHSYTYDATSAFVPDIQIADQPGRVLGYVGHGRHGNAPIGYLDASNPDGLQIELAPGAVFHSWESYSAHTFSRREYLAGQGLVAEWIERGGTAAIGHVEEPLASIFTVACEDQLFKMLLDGYTWAEAAWSAMPMLSHVNTVVGDPLMRWDAWAQGDVDLDGDVDGFDLVGVKGAYWTVEGDTWYRFYADMNANGVVDAWDLAFVKSHFTGPIIPQRSVSSDLTPEPASLGLLGLGSLVMLCRRRRRRALSKAV